MSGLVVRIDVMGERQISRQMLRFGERAIGAAPALEVVHDYLTHVSEGQFQSQGRDSGHPWPDIQEVTKERKRRSKDPTTAANADRIMEASEALKNSLTRQGDSNMVHVVTNDTMVFGTKLKYGQYHQKPGSSAAYPRRRSVDLTPTNKIVMIKTIQHWIVHGIAKLGSSRRFGL